MPTLRLLEVTRASPLSDTARARVQLCTHDSPGVCIEHRVETRGDEEHHRLRLLNARTGRLAEWESQWACAPGEVARLEPDELIWTLDGPVHRMTMAYRTRWWHPLSEPERRPVLLHDRHWAVSLEEVLVALRGQPRALPLEVWRLAAEDLLTAHARGLGDGKLFWLPTGASAILLSEVGSAPADLNTLLMNLLADNGLSSGNARRASLPAGLSPDRQALVFDFLEQLGRLELRTVSEIRSALEHAMPLPAARSEAAGCFFGLVPRALTALRQIRADQALWPSQWPAWLPRHHSLGQALAVAEDELLGRAVPLERLPERQSPPHRPFPQADRSVKSAARRKRD